MNERIDRMLLLADCRQSWLLISRRERANPSGRTSACMAAALPDGIDAIHGILEERPLMDDDPQIAVPPE